MTVRVVKIEKGFFSTVDPVYEEGSPICLYILPTLPKCGGTWVTMYQNFAFEKI